MSLKLFLITINDIKRVRPAYGLPPKYFDKILGSKLIKNVEAGDPVTWECIKTP